MDSLALLLGSLTCKLNLEAFPVGRDQRWGWMGVCDPVFGAQESLPEVDIGGGALQVE